MHQRDFMVWIVKIIVAWTVLFAIQIPLRKKGEASRRRQVFILKIILIPVAALAAVSFPSILSLRYDDAVMAVYIVLMGDAAADIVEYIIRRISCGRGKDRTLRHCVLPAAAILSAVFCLCIFLYGTANAGSVTVKKHTWKAEGLTQSHTFAFAADIHAGNAQSMDTLREFCRQVNSENPEFVILGGDITDELTSYDEMTAAYGILSELKAPVYFIYGNHDRQLKCDLVGGRTYSDEELADAVEGAGIQILSDEFAQVSHDLILLGREDASRSGDRKDWPELKNPYDGGALIVADHQPYDKAQLAVEVSALQLSGHTHAGQLWPLRFIYNVFGLPAYGEYEEPGTRLYVSAGESGWSMPLRTEARCEWELITLEPAD
ncbi:MAG: metallophosphoesterase [Firmicutes bacterium]|nr:metallophosphoesterase [Bacillota bacterium]